MWLWKVAMAPENVSTPRRKSPLFTAEDALLRALQLIADDKETCRPEDRLALDKNRNRA
jgi:hypothetical protein